MKESHARMFQAAPLRLVGAILLAAAVLKALAPHGLVGFLEFAGLPPALSGPTVLAIIGVEAAIGAALLVDPAWIWLNRVTLGLTLLFLAVPIFRWLAPDAPGCGCFGRWSNHG